MKLLRTTAARLLLALAGCAPMAGAVRADVGAHVVPMDGDRVPTDHTVLVEDGRIVAVGPASETVVPTAAAAAGTMEETP